MEHHLLPPKQHLMMFVPLALLAVTLLPLLDRGRVKLARWIASLTAIVGVAWMHWAPLYYEQLPQHMNFTYALDADSGQANYLVWSPNTLPANVVGATQFTESASPTPWDRQTSRVAPTTAIRRATIEIDRNTVSGTTRMLHLVPAATTDTIDLAIPEQAAVSAIRIDGLPVVSGSEPRNGYRVVRFVAPPRSGVTIEIDATPDPIDVYLIDSSNNLPDSARVLTDARGRLGVPLREGDRWLVRRKLKL